MEAPRITFDGEDLMVKKRKDVRSRVHRLMGLPAIRREVGIYPPDDPPDALYAETPPTQEKTDAVTKACRDALDANN